VIGDAALERTGVAIAGMADEAKRHSRLPMRRRCRREEFSRVRGSRRAYMSTFPYIETVGRGT
jgi:hypothetical protein